MWPRAWKICTRHPTTAALTETVCRLSRVADCWVRNRATRWVLRSWVVLCCPYSSMWWKTRRCCWIQKTSMPTNSRWVFPSISTTVCSMWSRSHHACRRSMHCIMERSISTANGWLLHVLNSNSIWVTKIRPQGQCSSRNPLVWGSSPVNCRVWLITVTKTVWRVSVIWRISSVSIAIGRNVSSVPRSRQRVRWWSPTVSRRTCSPSPAVTRSIRAMHIMTRWNISWIRNTGASITL